MRDLTPIDDEAIEGAASDAAVARRQRGCWLAGQGYNPS